MTIAACVANMTRVSSSSVVNCCPTSFPLRKKMPTTSSRWRTGAARKGNTEPKAWARETGATPWNSNESGSPAAARPLDLAEVVEERQPIRQLPELLGFFGGKARGKKVLHLPIVVEQSDHPVAGLGQRPGRVQAPRRTVSKSRLSLMRRPASALRERLSRRALYQCHDGRLWSTSHLVLVCAGPSISPWRSDYGGVGFRPTGAIIPEIGISYNILADG